MLLLNLSLLLTIWWNLSLRLLLVQNIIIIWKKREFDLLKRAKNVLVDLKSKYILKRQQQPILCFLSLSEKPLLGVCCEQALLLLIQAQSESESFLGKISGTEPKMSARRQRWREELPFSDITQWESRKEVAFPLIPNQQGFGFVF